MTSITQNAGILGATILIPMACGGGGQTNAQVPSQVTESAVASPPADPAPLPAAAETATPEPEIVTKAATSEPVPWPTECRSDGQLCLTPIEFAQAVCKGEYPGLAISLFQKSSPFTRGYVRMESIQAINTVGGRHSDAPLVFGEEVILLHHEGGSSGPVQVGGQDGYLALRWDGSCATLAGHEVVTWMPGAPRHAALVWNYIDTNIQDALLLNQRIKAARKQQRRQCKGGRLGPQTDSCQRATQRLNEQIVVAVRLGLEVPEPELLPVSSR